MQREVPESVPARTTNKVPCDPQQPVYKRVVNPGFGRYRTRGGTVSEDGPTSVERVEEVVWIDVVPDNSVRFEFRPKGLFYRTVLYTMTSPFPFILVSGPMTVERGQERTFVPGDEGKRKNKTQVLFNTDTN